MFICLLPQHIHKLIIFLGNNFHSDHLICNIDSDHQISQTNIDKKTLNNIIYGLGKIDRLQKRVNDRLKKVGMDVTLDSLQNEFKDYIYFDENSNDFQKVKATGDGSKSEDLSKTVRINTKYLEALIPSDLLTALCIEKLKAKV